VSSELFGTQVIDRVKVGNALSPLVGLSEEVLVQLADKVANTIQSFVHGGQEPNPEEFAEVAMASGLTADSLKDAIGVTSWLARWLNSESDTAEAIVADLVANDMIPATSADSMSVYLNRVLSGIPEDTGAVLDQRRVARRGLNSFDRIVSTANLRSVWNPENAGSEPHSNGYVPVAIITILSDSFSSPNTEFTFQAGPQDLGVLLEELTELRNELLRLSGVATTLNESGEGQQESDRR